MQKILVNLNEQLVREKSALSLDEVLALVNEWPADATCATQESDGEVLYWDAPVEVVEQARLRAGTGDMIREVGLASQIHATYLDHDSPVLAHDWTTAVCSNPLHSRA
ncbi:hypothetical protein [Stutzerimonas stutzeri]|uniref:hypothetical protein n=1 Tax=Stutzerimonas stutzeri TaxID=316 RepID=UPI00265D1C4D|nr:hypothetical protein [Stutzerimonas stutzeri]MCF6783738.1 hypothetical protein [Stutzerimonas stutzeri]